jgi:hypothetical protein
VVILRAALIRSLLELIDEVAEEVLSLNELLGLRRVFWGWLLIWWKQGRRKNLEK